MTEKEPESAGRISFRTDPEFRVRLLQIAEGLGIDLSALVNMMLKDAEPKFQSMAADLAVRRQRAESAWADAQDSIAFIKQKHPAAFTAETERLVQDGWVFAMHKSGLGLEEIAAASGKPLADVRAIVNAHAKEASHAQKPSKRPR